MRIEHELERDRFIERWPRKVRCYVGYGLAREKKHDRGCVSLLTRVRREIQQQGGQVLAIANERDLHEDFSRLSAQIRRDRQHAVLTQSDRLQAAEEMGLRVVDGKVLLPDLQLLVRRRDGYSELVNLEYASEHYRPHTLGAKRAAGFHLGMSQERRPRKVRDGANLVEI